MSSFEINQPLVNRYFAWRHGESEANTGGYIASTAGTALRINGLTRVGIGQVRAKAHAFKNAGLCTRDMFIISSPYRRCTETAKVIASVLEISITIIDINLRERNFGNLDGGPAHGYSLVWEGDARGETLYEAESVERVADRMASVVKYSECHYPNNTIILVSHADPLHILQAAFEGKSPREHRTIPYLKNSEYRELKLSAIT